MQTIERECAFFIAGTQRQCVRVASSRYSAATVYRDEQKDKGQCYAWVTTDAATSTQAYGESVLHFQVVLGLHIILYEHAFSGRVIGRRFCRGRSALGLTCMIGRRLRSLAKRPWSSLGCLALGSGLLDCVITYGVQCLVQFKCNHGS